MAKPKQTTTNPSQKGTGTGDKQDKVVQEVAATGSVAAPPVVRSKRAPGTKEVIPFQWKLVGEAEGLALTLFKAVEREEVEAHLHRLQQDPYYTKLRILDVKEPVKQPSPAKARALFAAGQKKSSVANLSKSKTKKKTTKKKSVKKRSAKARASVKRASSAAPTRKKKTKKKTRATRVAKARKSKKTKAAKKTKPVKKTKAAKKKKATAKASKKRKRTKKKRS